MKKTLIVALLSLIIGLNGLSQTLSIDDSLSALNITDTVGYGSSSSYTIQVEYLGGNYGGIVYLVAGVDSSGGLMSIDTVASQVVNFTGNDSIFFNVNDTFDNGNGYRVGGNVVVIWPIAAGLSALDTFQTDVYVSPNVGINDDVDLYEGFSVFPNPIRNFIYIEKTDQIIDVKRVRIFSVNGQIIYEEKFRPKIDISNIPPGLYFLKLLLKGGDELNYKLIKQ